MSANHPAREYSANDNVIRLAHSAENPAKALDFAAADALAPALPANTVRPEQDANAVISVLIPADILPRLRPFAFFPSIAARLIEAENLLAIFPDPEIFAAESSCPNVVDLVFAMAASILDPVAAIIEFDRPFTLVDHFAADFPHTIDSLIPQTLVAMVDIGNAFVMPRSIVADVFAITTRDVDDPRMDPLIFDEAPTITHDDSLASAIPLATDRAHTIILETAIILDSACDFIVPATIVTFDAN